MKCYRSKSRLLYLFTVKIYPFVGAHFFKNFALVSTYGWLWGGHFFVSFVKIEILSPMANLFSMIKLLFLQVLSQSVPFSLFLRHLHLPLITDDYVCLVLFSRLFLNHWLVFVKFRKHLLTIKPCIIEFAHVGPVSHEHVRPETVRVRVLASTVLTALVCNNNDNYLPNEKNTGNIDLQRS